MRRTFLASLFALALPAAPAAPSMTVYKTATCGCCGKWVDHLKANGFVIKVEIVPDTAIVRQKYGVPGKLASCHTGVIGAYSIEGHVPAADIKRLLKEKPVGKGLAVPGMPMGSPGMEGPQADAYATLLFDGEGRSTVFAKH